MPKSDANSGAARAENDQAWLFVLAAWILATASTLGALFFGEIMHLPPCSLCWYQRIFMFPLAIVLPFALFPSEPGVSLDESIVRAMLPLVGIGGVLALFQVLLVEGIIPERLEPCRQGVPCSETVIEWFGFITIPLLALFAFVGIGVLLNLALARSSR
jgi:disulfide bond formation protein DsbB